MFNRLLLCLLPLCLGSCALAQSQPSTLRRDIPTTSELARRALTNETAAGFQQAIGIVGHSNFFQVNVTNDFSLFTTNQVSVLNALTNPPTPYVAFLGTNVFEETKIDFNTQLVYSITVVFSTNVLYLTNTSLVTNQVVDTNTLLVTGPAIGNYPFLGQKTFLWQGSSHFTYPPDLSTGAYVCAWDTTNFAVAYETNYLRWAFIASYPGNNLEFEASPNLTGSWSGAVPATMAFPSSTNVFWVTNISALTNIAPVSTNYTVIATNFIPFQTNTVLVTNFTGAYFVGDGRGLSNVWATSLSGVLPLSSLPAIPSSQVCGLGSAATNDASTFYRATNPQDFQTATEVATQIATAVASGTNGLSLALADARYATPSLVQEQAAAIAANAVSTNAATVQALATQAAASATAGLLSTNAADARYCAAGSFSVAVLPDTQYLVASYPGAWTNLCRWIATNATGLNIKAVLHEGDLVDNAMALAQWTNALAGLNIIRACGLPLIISPGNHDMDYNPQCRWQTNWSTYLPNSYFQSFSNWNGGFIGPTNWASYLIFTNAGEPYLVLATAWLPDTNTMSYVASVANQYSNLPAIYLTHLFVGDSPTGRRAGWGDNYNVESGNGDLATWITPNHQWDWYISQTRNVFAVLSGHLFGWPTDGNTIGGVNAAHFQEPARDGHLVLQSLCDYQYDDATGQGCDAFVGILTITPSSGLCRWQTWDSGLNKPCPNTAFAFCMTAGGTPQLSRWQNAKTASSNQNNLVFSLDFESTNTLTLRDQSAFGMSVTGLAIYGPGLGGGQSLYALSNGVQVADMDVLNGMSNLTAMVWCKEDTNYARVYQGNAGAPQIILGQVGSGGTDLSWYISTHSNNCTYLINVDGAPNRDACGYNANQADGNWHHYALSWDGTNISGYYDGTNVVNLASTAGRGRLQANNWKFCIGGDTANATVTNVNYGALGWIDNVKVFNKALGPGDIAREYSSGIAAQQAMARTSTNLTVGGYTLYITNGVIMRVQ